MEVDKSALRKVSPCCRTGENREISALKLFFFFPNFSFFSGLPRSDNMRSNLPCFYWITVHPLNTHPHLPVHPHPRILPNTHTYTHAISENRVFVIPIPADFRTYGYYPYLHPNPKISGAPPLVSSLPSLMRSRVARYALNP